MTQTQFLLRGKIQYEAEWIKGHGRDTNGIWYPETAASQHTTKKEAETAAIKASKAAGQCEWILVAEQKYVDHAWVDIRRWTGDWDGLCEKTFDAEVTDAE